MSLRLTAIVAALLMLIATPAAAGAATRQLAPGETFEHAYNVSQAGDVIQVPAGT